MVYTQDKTTITNPAGSFFDALYSKAGIQQLTTGKG